MLYPYLLKRLSNCSSFVLFKSVVVFTIVLTVLPKVMPNSAAASEDVEDLIAAYRQYASPLASYSDLQPLIDRAGETKLVLLGESTHGTSEYYTWRAAISQKLIEEKGFNFIAVEGDWISMSRLNRYVKHKPDAAESARQALLELDQWPHWMWANEEFAELGEWLREFNRDRPMDQRVGIYGMDVYAPWDAIDAVLAYYRENHPDKQESIREYYAEFTRYRDNPREYALAAGSISEQVFANLKAVFDKTERLWEESPAESQGDAFFAKQSARVAKGAERFYSSMGRGGPDSWNHRVAHMKTTVDRLLAYYGEASRGIVWAHNTHVGDARATTMAQGGQYNIGQLSRLTYGETQVYLIGFSTFEGEVLASREWDGRMETMPIPPGKEGSFEAALKGMDLGDALIQFPYSVENADETPDIFRRALDHRAIGVIYHPEVERTRNYVPSLPALRYDALIYLEETSTLSPMHDHLQ